MTGELGSFLNSCRSRLRPADVGLPVHGRRRTQGLRREEVAALAGVSVDYYTRLEQGRDRHPSPPIVRALATALRLTHDERTHLHRLAGQAPPHAGTAVGRHVPPQRRELLFALEPLPAYLLNGALDVLAWNDAADVVLGDLAVVVPRERNIVRLTLLHPPLRSRWAAWDAIAREAIAQLRAASARRPGDPQILALVDELAASSPEFAHWWTRQDVMARCHLPKQVAHPEFGTIHLVHELLVLEEDDQSVVTYLPADDASRAALHRVAAARAPAAGGHLRAVP